MTAVAAVVFAATEETCEEALRGLSDNATFVFSVLDFEEADADTGVETCLAECDFCPEDASG
jgi:hypothetical protein